MYIFLGADNSSMSVLSWLVHEWLRQTPVCLKRPKTLERIWLLKKISFRFRCLYLYLYIKLSNMAPNYETTWHQTIIIGLQTKTSNKRKTLQNVIFKKGTEHMVSLIKMWFQSKSHWKVLKYAYDVDLYIFKIKWFLESNAILDTPSCVRPSFLIQKVRKESAAALL